MSSINFDNVYLLFLLIPLLLLVAVPFALAVRKDNVNGHNIASVTLHTLMAVFVAFAAAGTQINAVMTETDVYVVADVSYSAEKNLDRIDELISEIETPRNTKLGIVCFGKDHQILTPLGGRIKSVKRAEVNDTETNLRQALEYTGTLFKNNVTIRIVLITDGKQSFERDADGLKSTVANLQAQNIHIYPVFLDDSLKDGTNEIQISDAKYTRNAYLDRSETLSVTIESSFVTRGTVTLFKGGERFAEKTERFSIGSNTLSFELDTSSVGSFDYEVVLKAEGDESDRNNRYAFTQTVSDDLNVLLITSSEADREEISKYYGDSVSIDSYVNNRNVPFSIGELCRYDEIVLSNVDVTQLENYEMFLYNLERTVYTLGKNLVTFGDLGIHSKKDGELNDLNQILPINYGKTNDNPKLYTIVMDISHSMQYWSRMIVARQAAIKLIEAMDSKDYVCIIGFSGDVEVLLKPTVVGDKSAATNAVRNAGFAQGTLTSLGLTKAFETVRNQNFSDKRAMLITDGLTYKGLTDGQSDMQKCNSIVSSMRASEIYTSVLHVGGGYSAEEQKWLKELGKNFGGGEYFAMPSEEFLAGDLYFAKNDEKDEDESVVKGRPAFVELNKPLDNVIYGDGQHLEKVDMTDSFVTDYVIGKRKTNATTVLSVLREVQGSTVEVPLYAYWMHGNGRVSSYSGALSGLKVPTDHTSSGLNAVFFGNVVSSALPAEKSDYPFLLSAKEAGKSVRLELTPVNLTESLSAQMQLSVILPSGEQTTEDFVYHFDAESSYFYCSYDLSDLGSYRFTVTFQDQTGTYTATMDYRLAYEPEYNAFEIYDVSSLTSLGCDRPIVTDGVVSIVNGEDDIIEYNIHLQLYLLIACVVLYVIDVIVRKLKWSDIVSLFGRAGRKK